MRKMICTGCAFSVMVIALAATKVNAVIITQWNFNGDSATTVPGGSASPTPSIGTGTAALVGGTTATFASGIASGGSTDPATTVPPNYGWNTTTYPAQGTNDKTAGVRFDVSTVGHSTVYVYWDQRHSNTSSRFVQFQYTLDGSVASPVWVEPVDGLFSGPSGDTWFNQRQVDLSSVVGVANNPNFAFRILSTFEPGGSGYVASNPASSYAPTGTWRFDMVTVATEAIPEPASLSALSLAGLLAMRRRASR